MVYSNTAFIYTLHNSMSCMVYFIHCTGREHIELDVFLFREVLDHMARVDRVLTSPRGSLLLSGQSGVGRRTAVRLVAHMHQLEIVTPHISRNYTLKHFRNDLKSVCDMVYTLCHVQYVQCICLHLR